MLKIRFPQFTQEKGNAALFFSINALFYMAVACYMPYLSAHYASLGIDSFRIGILSSMGPVCAILILPIWSRISDVTGNRRGVLKIICLGASLSVLLLLVSKTFWPLLFSVFLFVCFFGAFVPLGDAITVSYLAKTSISFSSVRIGGTYGYIFMILISGHLFNYNSSLSFIVCSIFFLILFFFVGKMPQVSVSTRQRKKLELRRLFKNKKIIFILLFSCVIQIATSFYFSFLGVYIRELGYTSTQIGYASFIAALSEIPILLFIDRVLTRFSVPSIAIFSGFIMAMRLLLLQGADNMVLVYVAQIGHGLTYMTLYYSCVTFLNNEMEEDLKSSGQSMLAFFQTGIGSIVGTLMGGYISNRIGIRDTYLYYGICLSCICMACALAFLFLSWRKKRSTQE